MDTNLTATATQTMIGSVTGDPDTSHAAAWTARIALAARACCCSAKPTFVAIMPPASGRPAPVDLMLCGHHYRSSADALQAANATVYCAPR